MHHLVPGMAGQDSRTILLEWAELPRSSPDDPENEVSWPGVTAPICRPQRNRKKASRPATATTPSTAQRAVTNLCRLWSLRYSTYCESRRSISIS